MDERQHLAAVDSEFFCCQIPDQVRDDSCVNYKALAIM